jgi:hypothetical protein
MFQANHSGAMHMQWRKWMVVGALAITPALRAQDGAGMVANPGFELPGIAGETDAQAWTEPGDPKDAQLRVGGKARTGQWSLLSVDNGAQSGLTPNSTQIVTLTSDMAGKTCRLWAWACIDKDQPLADGGAMLKITFLDGNSAIVGKPSDKRFLDKNGKPGEWVRGEVSAVVPEGARTAKLQVMHHWGGKDAGGALLFDDVGFDVESGASAAGAAALLSQGDFEAAGAWTLPTSPKDAITRSDAAARSGKWSLRSVDDGSMSNAFPNASQVVSIAVPEGGAAPRRFRLRAWTMTPADRPLTDGSAMLKVEFTDAAGAAIGKARDTTILRAGQTPGQWVVGELVADLPEGTRRVKVQLMHNYGGKDQGGVIHFDDAAFELLP